MSANYSPYVNPVALEAATWRFGDDALASSTGTSAVVSGADSARNAGKALETPPETKKSAVSVGDILDYFLADKFSKATTLDTSGKPWYERHSTLLWSVVLVVLALFMFSRGLGMIGEEGAETVLQFEDPSKYPGIGHAIQRMKKKKG